MTYDFGGSLYPNTGAMCAAIAESWLRADGANCRQDMVDVLIAMTDEDLADECIEMWGLDTPDSSDSDNQRSWFENRNADRDMLVAAFADLRREFDQRFPADTTPEER